MTSDAPAATAGEPRGFPSWLAPVAVVLFLVVGLGAIVVLSRRANSTEAPPLPAAFATPAPARPVQSYDVRQASATSLQLATADQSGGQERTLTLDPATRWEILEPMAESEVAVGDWLTVIAVPNVIRAFSIRSVVVFPADSTPAADGIPRSAAGFSGYEAARDPLEAPVMSGRVTAIGRREGTTETARGLVPATYLVLTLAGPAGDITVDLQEGASFARYRIAPAAASDVRDGDRVAFDATDGTPPAILILPGGAQ